MTSSYCEWTLKPLSFHHSTDLRNRLRSHYPVTHLEAAQFAIFLSAAEAGTLRYDAEHSRDRHSPIIMPEKARTELESCVYAYRSLLSPIRRLPIELLTDIFFHCRGANKINPCCPWPDDEQHPVLLTLGAVCAAWRNIILSDSRFWSTISVQGNITRLELLELYIERSGNLPLTLDVEDVYPVAMEVSVLKCLIAHSRRWLDVYMFINLSDSDDIAVDVFSGLAGNIPLLKTLNFTAYYLSTPVYSFDIAPRLRSLTLQYTPSMTFPWESLIHLERSGINVYEFIENINLCPNLESARLTCCQGSDDGPSEEGNAIRSRVVSSDLHTFSMDIHKVEGLGFVSSLFEAVTFPQINSIALTSRNCSFFSLPWPQDVFRGFLRRSSYSLTTLSLIRIPISEPDLISLLRLLRCLTSLTFEEVSKTEENLIVQPSVSNTLFHTLNTDRDIADSTRSTLLPKLQYLELQAGGSAVSEEDFIQMVRSRWWPARSYSKMHRSACLLTAFLTVTDRSWDPSIVKPLRDLRKAGMKIMVYAMVAPSPQERENRGA